MLQIQNISKKYVTGDFVQSALDGVSLTLRDSEFVAILGPSGSGKTTFLNIVGGLDRYDSGDLVINGISTKKYKDRDWDSYRNHTVGFVFQSYNLIPHQSVLSNVELALTISGVSRGERKKRAAEALEQVGLGQHLHKKPNQLSGGQMQRVAIARALVNDPDILLADEPTGALDSETSVQVMDLLRQVAKERLVVMVTHNPELAETYANRIVRLRDGKIIEDTHPCEESAETASAPQHKSMGRTSMSFFTSLALSFQNLKTKKGRTLLTAFAGSIGIIGIALILSLSNGVDNYIADIQKDTMTSYPITIEAKTLDLTSMMASATEDTPSADHSLDAVFSNGRNLENVSTMTASMTENNLTAFKKYLDDPASPVQAYVGENGILYAYDTAFAVYARDPDNVLVNTDGSTLADSSNQQMNRMLQGQPTTKQMTTTSGMMGASTGNANFAQMLPGQEGATSVNEAVKTSYDLVYGTWPAAFNEVMLVLDKNNEISATSLYQLGLLPSGEYRKLMKQIENGEKVTLDDHQWRYEDICGQTFYLLPACDTYVANDRGTFDKAEDGSAQLEKLLESAVKLKAVGVIRPTEGADHANIEAPVGYTKALTDYLIDHAKNSAVVKAQEQSPSVNVVSGLTFSSADDAAKIADARTYLTNLNVSGKASMARTILLSGGDAQMSAQMSAMSETQLAAMLDGYLKAPDGDTLLKIYDGYISSGSYDDNMTAFGLVSLDAPSSISIYTDSFENKDAVAQCIKDYNATASDADQITYTDYVGLLMSSVTTIIHVISYVLVAFVAVSLVVSSIMIGIITYISVLERTKEIGILRAIGASKHNISQVFNAETFIIGLCAGAMGIGITLLLLIPGNAIVHSLTGTADVNASLPMSAGAILVALSVVLTLIGGLIPARKAAKKDPVTALRTE